MFRLADPWWLLLAPAAAAAALLVFRRAGRGSARAILPDAGALAPLGRSPWTLLERALPWVRAVAVGLAVVALARPQWGHAVENVSSLGVDVVVAVDVSDSMRCEDERPRNRLEVARGALRRFIEGRPADRIGLVSFASLAVTRCPLTLDHPMLERFVDELDFAEASQSGTALGMGLASAVNRLRGSNAKSRVAVLLTDGINNQGQIGPDAAAQAARALGIRVYTIGVGTRGEVACPVDTPFGTRFVPQRQDLDEDLLRKMAQETGGTYFRATDAKGLEDAFATIDTLEKTEFESRIRVLWSDRFPSFLAPAGALLLLELLLAATRLRRIP